MLRRPQGQMPEANSGNQRDHVMGIAAALAKENAELKARISKLEVAEPENQDGNAI
jgi:hypothetical protein